MLGLVASCGIMPRFMWHDALIMFDKRTWNLHEVRILRDKNERSLRLRINDGGYPGFHLRISRVINQLPLQKLSQTHILIGVEAGGQFTSTRAWFFKKAWLFESKRFWWKNCLLSNVLVTQPIPYVNQIQIKPTFRILLPYQSFNPRW